VDADIQFGDIAEESPRETRRPDEDPRFAVLPCGSVQDHDLPIYVDLDCLLDMEEHALSNAEVELGGVMLGGQYVDSEQQPFVIVNESLRAEHYESTRGSFKFTHDTWSNITRRLEEYTTDTKMVGWYHTHPDWGVFLSGMDLFICDNFFNKPLDLALVIDPCRHDRGWFQWTGRSGEQPRRTGGFYLYSSRFRHEELAYYAQVLEGSLPMPNPVRSGNSNAAGYSAGSPVIQVVAERSPLVTIAVLGMLTLQSMFLFFLAWYVIAGGSHDALEQLLERERTAAAIEAKQKTLDKVAEHLGSKPEFATSLANKEMELLHLQTQLESVTTATSAKGKRIESLEESLEASKESNNTLKTEKKKLQVSVDKLVESQKTLQQEIKDKTLNAAEGTSKYNTSLWIAGSLVGGIMAFAAGAYLFQAPRSLRPDFQEPDEHGQTFLAEATEEIETRTPTDTNETA
jgi:proteasome lid subunit RPN8/RPN11